MSLSVRVFSSLWMNQSKCKINDNLETGPKWRYTRVCMIYLARIRNRSHMSHIFWNLSFWYMLKSHWRLLITNSEGFLKRGINYRSKILYTLLRNPIVVLETSFCWKSRTLPCQVICRSSKLDSSNEYQNDGGQYMIYDT